MGEAGRGFVEAYADLLGGVVETAAGPAGLLTEAAVGDAVAIAVQAGDLADDPLPYQATSAPLGEALLQAVRGRPRRVLVDLTGLARPRRGRRRLRGARVPLPMSPWIAAPRAWAV